MESRSPEKMGISSASPTKETTFNHATLVPVIRTRDFLAAGRFDVGFICTFSDRKKMQRTLLHRTLIKHMVKSEMTPKNSVDFWKQQVWNLELISSVFSLSITTPTMLVSWEAITET